MVTGHMQACAIVGQPKKCKGLQACSSNVLVKC